MRKQINFFRAGMLILIISCFLVLFPTSAGTHCDTLDGPVIKDAKASLEKGDVTPVLKWVKKEYETEIRELFAKTLKVRSKGPEAKDLADMYFFETLVRLHRAGEGAPYTGLKPAGSEIGPVVTGADKALETGSVDALVKLIIDSSSSGIRKRFERVMETKKHADASVEAGREYVETYVEFVHYAEKLYEVSSEAGNDHEGSHGTHETHE